MVIRTRIRKISRFVWIALYVVVVTFLLLIMIDRLKEDAYASTSRQVNENLENLIESKTDALRLLAISLADSPVIRNALITGDRSSLYLDTLSLQLRNDSVMKNLWFHIIDDDGFSFYRSWTKRTGDNLLAVRTDIASLLKRPDNISTISTGKYDLSFKSIVPIYNNGDFVGFFEVIAKFNSIAKKMNADGYKPVYLVDPSYSRNITSPFSDIFIYDFYVANKEADPELVVYLRNNDQLLQHLITNKHKNYLMLNDTEHMLVYYPIPDINGNPMAHLFSFVPLNRIDTHSVTQLAIMLILAAVLLITIAMENNRKENNS